jgi:DNA-binding winged helix-turn-helix (wHTH) protein/predicted Zn-dependent protease
MSLQAQSASLLRCGVFEIDLRAGELRKQGVRIKLQEQPFLVLKILLTRPGEVVSREEIRSQIWSADTFVDFDNSLNTAINKLREALGDTAESPRFIETLPRRGYRFIAPVTSIDARPRPSTVASPLAHSKPVIAVAVLVLLAGTALGLFWYLRPAHRLTGKDTIVIGDFANSTGDPVFDRTLREGLSVELEQSPFLSLVSEQGVGQALLMMGHKSDTRLTPEIAREICQRTNSAAALHGSIALIGTRYNLILKAVNCVNGDVLASTEAQANDKSHVLNALGKMASEMRSKLGESLISLQKYNAPLEQATTPSLEALHAYSLGFKSTWVASDQAAALPLLQRATQFDRNFAMAYWAMSNAYLTIGESTLAAESIRKAFDLREGTTELEKLLIETDYNSFLTGDLMKLRRSAEVGSQTYPREAIFHLDLAVVANFLGQYETGLKEYREALRLAPYNSFFCRQLIYTYLLLNRANDAAVAAKEARAKGLDTDLAAILYGMAFYRNDSGEMAREVASTAGKPGDEDLLLALEADTAAFFGLLKQAGEFSRQATDSAERAGEKETAATYWAVSGLREALFGDAEEARQRTAIAKRLSSGRDLDYAVALASEFAGDARRAQAIIDDLAKRFPEDTIVQCNYLPTLRAKLAVLHSEPQHALDLLRAAAPYELGLPAFSFYNWPNLYPIYVRGEAYLAAHQGSAAAAEFQKILDHRGVVLNEPIGALTRLQLARAYGLQGDTAKARAGYQDFLTLCKDADPDIPILKRAKAEYAKLQ